MIATESQAHAEWHRNSGVPMGLSGCPWDACDEEMLDEDTRRRLYRIRDLNWAYDRGEEGDAAIRCAHCRRVHLSVAAVRECAKVAH